MLLKLVNILAVMFSILSYFSISINCNHEPTSAITLSPNKSLHQATEQNAIDPASNETFDVATSVSVTLMTDLNEQIINNEKEDGFASETELGEWLFANYSRNRRPRKHAKDAVQVSLSIFIYNINDIVEKSHEMKITCALEVRWHDEYLIWNESERFSSIESLVVERDEVWIPDVALVNSGDMYALMMAEGILANVRNDGNVEFLPMSTITSFCDLDLTYFPFDYQSCYLRFESWTYEPHQETFRLSESPVNLNNLKINEQWEVLRAESELQDYCYSNKSKTACYPGAEFVLYFKRKAAYYNVNIIIPSLIIAILEVVTFSLPTAEVLKIHISFTCLLAYAVFQTTVNADMPRTSEHTPLMSIYIDLQMSFIGVALLGEGCVFICLGQAEHLRSVPKGLRQICNFLSHLNLVDAVNADIEEEIYEKQEGASANLDLQVPGSAMNPGYNVGWTTLSNWQSASDSVENVFDESKEDGRLPNGRRGALFSELPDETLKNLKRKMFEERKEQTNERESMKIRRNQQQNRRDWLFIADIAERLTLIIYVLCISITPLVIFYILPAKNSGIPLNHKR